MTKQGNRVVAGRCGTWQKGRCNGQSVSTRRTLHNYRQAYVEYSGRRHDADRCTDFNAWCLLARLKEKTDEQKQQKAAIWTRLEASDKITRALVQQAIAEIKGVPVRKQRATQKDLNALQEVLERRLARVQEMQRRLEVREQYLENVLEIIRRSLDGEDLRVLQSVCHPDRNSHPNATKAFQIVQRMRETFEHEGIIRADNPPQVRKAG